ncbi:DNA-binding MarR family transcriptional regulator [Rhodoligotrophos appendicifer]|uniref:MarR family winged helix-turn-helix transcriptional regulator n=1 Tax=Rhodoligotrophos appendicifer TaxID=987056 RepID=UPI001186ADAD|nr:MarR family transcriptional regulator [Rhodoligotrophos appendicifer]
MPNRKDLPSGNITHAGSADAREHTSTFVPPKTVSHDDLLVNGSDDTFRHVIYLIVEVLGRLTACREAFGRSVGLTGSQFAVLIGVAYRQGNAGISIKALAQYVHLAPTHVTTEVGRLIRLGLLAKRAANKDRRSVLVSLTGDGEAMVLHVTSLVRRINDVLFAGLNAADLVAAQSIFGRLSRNGELAIAEIKVAEREMREGVKP